MREWMEGAALQGLRGAAGLQPGGADGLAGALRGCATCGRGGWRS